MRTNDNIEKTNNQQEMEEYDVFVSHAWEDKESFADEFVEALESVELRYGMIQPK